MKKTQTSGTQAASALITQRIADLGDWRGETLSRMRKLIHEADPNVVEEWKWMGVPVWSHDGILCTGESYKKIVKLTFHKGASLPDPAKLFNAGLEGNARRAIDIPEGTQIDATAFKALIRAAVDLNSGNAKPKNTASKKTASKKTASKKKASKKTASKKTASKKTASKKTASKTRKPRS